MEEKLRTGGKSAAIPQLLDTATLLVGLQGETILDLRLNHTIKKGFGISTQPKSKP